MSSVVMFNHFWEDFFKRQPSPEEAIEELLGPLREFKLSRKNKYSSVFESVMDAIDDQKIYYPEPYFGFIGKGTDTSNDALGLFMNPGKARNPTVFWNDEVVKQYLEMTPLSMLQECGVSDMGNFGSKPFTPCKCYMKEKEESGCNSWRRRRYYELRVDIGKKSADANIRFLHSQEIFPFHSKNFDSRIKSHLEAIYTLPFMRLALDAIKEIAEQNTVKYIFAIGVDWEHIFDTMDWFSSNKALFSTGPIKRVAHYQSSKTSSPIITIVRRVPNVMFNGNNESNEYIRKIISGGPKQDGFTIM